jgi:Skp family chaperone for outer membrane proteins
MEIRIIDFEILTQHYLKYSEGRIKIKELRSSFMERLKPLKNEMELILSSESSGMSFDESTQKVRYDNFQKLQQDAMDLDYEFKSEMSKMKSNLSKKTFSEFSEMITEWSIENSIDLVTGKMEVVFVSDKFDATNDILEILKVKNLYIEKVEEEEEESV